MEIKVLKILHGGWDLPTNFRKLRNLSCFYWKKKKNTNGMQWLQLWEGTTPQTRCIWPSYLFYIPISVPPPISYSLGNVGSVFANISIFSLCSVVTLWLHIVKNVLRGFLVLCWFCKCNFQYCFPVRIHLGIK